MRSKQIKLANIRLDGDTQPRTEINDFVVDEYAELLKSGTVLPPVIVFFDGKDNWLAEGFHRHKAHRKAGKQFIQCDVRKGSLADARWFSYSANQAHGLRRSNADKQRAVKASLKHTKGTKLSDKAISEHCGVSQPFVSKLRSELESLKTVISQPARTGRDGRTINTENIGRAKPPEAPPEAEGERDEPPADNPTQEDSLDCLSAFKLVRAHVCKILNRMPSNAKPALTEFLRTLADQLEDGTQ